MKNKVKLLALALVAGGTMFAQTRFSIGVGIGAPAYGPPPAYVNQYVPPCPGPGYSWVDGYWAPQGGRQVWIDGFWRAPAYVAPRYGYGYGNGYGYGYGFRDRDHYRDFRYRGHDRDDWHHGDRDGRYRR